MNVFQEERAANLVGHEATNACFDALTRDLANSKVKSDSTEHISQYHHTKLDSPRFNGQEDILGWLNKCVHSF